MLSTLQEQAVRFSVVQEVYRQTKKLWQEVHMWFVIGVLLIVVLVVVVVRIL